MPAAALTLPFSFLLFGGISLPSAHAQVALTGAGALFPAPLYTKWFAEYKKVDSSVSFNHQPIGSGGGQKQISEGTIDFGATDGPMPDGAMAKAPGKILHLPTVAGAVVMTYNLPGKPKVKLDSDTIAAIYLGKIKKWTDPAIKKTEPEIRFSGLGD